MGSIHNNNLTIPDGYIDLTAYELSADDLKNYQFIVDGNLTTQDKTVKIAFSQLNSSTPKKNLQSSLNASTLTPIKKDASNTSIIAVAQAFDIIAKKEIEESNSFDLTNLTLEEGLSKIKSIMQRLNYLSHNLRAHDQVIANYNSWRILNRCSDHLIPLRLIREQKERMQGLKTQLFINEIEKARSSIEQGEFIDDEYIFTSYEETINLSLEAGSQLSDIRNRSQILDAKERYQAAVNQRFLQAKIHKLETKNIEIPCSIRFSLQKFGWSESQIKEEMTKLFPKVREFSENILNTRNLNEFTPLELSKEIIEHMEGLIVDKLPLGDPEKGKLKQLLKKIDLFEKNWDAKLYKSLKNIKNEELEFIKTLELNPEKEEEKTRYIQFMKAEDPLKDEAVNEILKAFDVIQLIKNTSEDDFATFLNSFLTNNKTLEKYDEYFSEDMGLFQNEIHNVLNQERDLWLEKNKVHQKFSYDQSSWGIQNAAHEGVCSAINYRWIKNLLKNPTLNIKSYQDLDSGTLKDSPLSKIMDQIRKNKINASFIQAKQKAERQKIAETGISEVEFDHRTPSAEEEINILDSESGIKAKDRKHQALYNLQFPKILPPSISKKDNIRVQVIADIPYKKNMKLINEVFEYIDAHDHIDFNLSNSHGILQLGIDRYRENSSGILEAFDGHAMGLQIDDLHSIYRFWDPNRGLYSYETKAALKTAMASYMEAFYGSYSGFDLVQFSEINPSIK